MLKVFLDTNVYLNFYHYHDDEVEELRKLIVLIDEGKLILFVTEQVKNEFSRNREVKIKDALKTFTDSKTPNFPNLIKNLDDFQKLNEATKLFNENKKKIIQELSEKVEKFELEADRLISELFKKSMTYEIDEETLTNAKLRYDLGNPPGKNGSYGDAINWELLLKHCKSGEDIVFVGVDKDFKSVINDRNFNPFLLREWRKSKKSEILFYKSLSDFFQQTFPGIILSSDLNRQVKIESFINSYNFKQTRHNIHKLKLVFPIRTEEYQNIIDYMRSNPQIYWVGTDEDINMLFHEIIDPLFHTLTYEEQVDLISKYGDNGGKIIPTPF